MAETYSLAEVVRRTGAKRRAVQLWADGFVISSSAATDRGGTGVHRLFASEELIVAAILVPLADMGVPIGVLRRVGWIARFGRDIDSYKAFAGALRFVAERAGITEEVLPQPGEAEKELGAAIERALRGEGQNLLLLAHTQDQFWTEVVTDVAGPVSIDPQRQFPEIADHKRVAIIMLDLTKLLRGLLD